MGFVDTGELSLGATTTVAATWRPMSTVSEATRELFLGGAREWSEWGFVKGTEGGKVREGEGALALALRVLMMAVLSARIILNSGA